MQRSGHRSIGCGRLIYVLGMACAVMLAVGGCRQDQSAGQPSTVERYRRRLGAAGKRVVVVDGQDHRVAKLRKRHHKYKVYNSAMVAVGYVRWTAQAGDQPPVSVTWRPVGGGDGQRLVRSSAADPQHPAALRMDHTAKGWSVVGADGAHLGEFARLDDGRWQLRRRAGQSQVLRVDEGDEKPEVVADDQPVMRLQVGQLGAVELLGFALDDLSVLERAAIGVWLRRARPEPS